MKKWLSSIEIGALLDRTARFVRSRAQKEDWIKRKKSVRGGQQYYYALSSLPEDIQTAYAATKNMTLTELQSTLNPPSNTPKNIQIRGYSSRTKSSRTVQSLENLSENYRQVGLLKADLIGKWETSGLTVEQFVKKYNAGMFAAISEKLGKYGNIKHPSTFYRWLRDYEQKGLVGLCPQYKLSRGGNGKDIPQQAKEIIEALYLDYRKPSVASVERDIKQFGYDINYSLVYRYLKDLPKSVITYYREGIKAYHDKFDPYIPRDYTLFKTMEWGVGDHHMMDIVIRHNDRLMRPWVTAFDDMRSRYRTGWWVDAIPDTITILRALDMTLRDCGAFQNLLIDNGKDFKGLWLSGNEWKVKRLGRLTESIEHLVSGVFRDCGFNVHFCTPYRGQSKPIERAFRTDIEQFEKYIETYVGSNTITRPEEAKLYWSKIGNREKKDVFLTLELLREIYADYVKYLNTQCPHTGHGMDGKTRKQVFEENWTVRRILPDEYRRLVMTRREERKVHRNGVKIDGIYYYNPELAQYIGSLVKVFRGLNDVGKVWIYLLPKLTYLCEAYSDVLKDLGIPEENLRRQRKAQKKSRQHLKKYGQHAAAIRRSRKSPAQLLAEEKQNEVKLTPQVEQEIQVVNGNIELPYSPDNGRTGEIKIIKYPKKKKRKPKLKRPIHDA